MLVIMRCIIMKREKIIADRYLKINKHCGNCWMNADMNVSAKKLQKSWRNIRMWILLEQSWNVVRISDF